MFKLNIFTVLFFSIFIISDEDLINEKITTILPPGTNIESIELSEFPGIYKVYYGDIQPLYVSQNGDFFIYGDMFNISSDGIINLTDKDILQKRKLLMQEITNEELISFKAKNELFTVTVFTDVDCGYCRKLHDEITTYNEVGITINYAAFPKIWDWY
jgi:Protein-disulfide isomerase